MFSQFFLNFLKFFKTLIFPLNKYYSSIVILNFTLQLLPQSTITFLAMNFFSLFGVTLIFFNIVSYCIPIFLSFLLLVFIMFYYHYFWMSFIAQRGPTTLFMQISCHCYSGSTFTSHGSLTEMLPGMYACPLNICCFIYSYFKKPDIKCHVYIAKTLIMIHNTF